MRTLAVGTCWAVAIVVFISTICVTDAADKACQAAIAEITKRQVAQVSACSKELNLSPKEKSKKMNCVMKCILKKEKLLNDQGKFDTDSIKKMIDEEMPKDLEHLREAGEAMFNKCRQEHEPNLDNSDEFCKSYGPLVKCLMSMMDLCK